MSLNVIVSKEKLNIPSFPATVKKVRKYVKGDKLKRQGQLKHSYNSS